MLKENNISCSPTKTEIGFVEVEYLGHRLSAESVRISENVSRLLVKFSLLKTLKLCNVCWACLIIRKNISNTTQKHISYVPTAEKGCGV